MNALLKDKKIAFIGAGNMAEAIFKGMLSSGVAEPSQVRVTDKLAERTAHFHAAYGVDVAEDNASAVAQADVVVLAVKPQVMGDVLADVSGAVKRDQVFISIAAGIRCEAIEAGLGGSAHVIRVMPNTPALVGQGISGLCRGAHASEHDQALAAALMSSVGRVVPVDEGQMDAVTAVSGSGPAYIFYVIEAMLEAALELGLEESVAKSLVYDTVAGAAALVSQDGSTPAALRARVTSKGGTTAAAIGVLDAQGVKEAMIEAIRAAANRSKELSDT